MNATRPALPSETAHVDKQNSNDESTKPNKNNSFSRGGINERPVRGNNKSRNMALSVSRKAVSLNGGASIKPTLREVQP